MRLPVLLVTSVLAFSCTSSPGPEGPQGVQGPVGSQGPAGPAGPKGDDGAMGLPGLAGAQGPAGPQGVQGPAGAVLVVDGGTVVGPPGFSVLVTPVAAGGQPCPTGGVRLTQLSDAGVTHVCNGGVGATGATGPAGAQGVAGPVGPMGPMGPMGPQGASVRATTLTAGSPQCMTGGLLITFPDAGTAALCNGAQGVAGPAGAQGIAGPAGLAGAQGLQGVAGPAGPTGVAGPAGAQGLQGVAGPAGAQGLQGPAGAAGASGPAGPAGPVGAVLYLDGGVVVNGDWVSFAGFTAASYTGNLGGRVGGHALCAAEFAGSHFCDEHEYTGSFSSAPVPATSAWIDDHDPSQPAARGLNYVCNRWTGGTVSHEGQLVRPDGTIGTSYVSLNNYGCSTPRPLACCFSARKSTFRGFTPTSYTGNLGGRVGAHATCGAAFPGSHFCDEGEYASSHNGALVPTGGAWVDDYDAAMPGKRGLNYVCNRWSGGTVGFEGLLIRTDGTIGTSYVSLNDYGCATPRPIACCSN